MVLMIDEKSIKLFAQNDTEKTTNVKVKLKKLWKKRKGLNQSFWIG